MILEIRIPEDIPFIKSVTDCVLQVANEIRPSCSLEALVDTQMSIDAAIEIVTREVNNNDRVSPVAISRLGRGGKTTLLYLLFEKLKMNGFCPIFISFNGNFKRSIFEETQEQTILREIALQFIDIPSNIDTMKIVCNKEAILKHIANTCDNKPIVLLIDELNMLPSTRGDPLDQDSAMFIRQFLDTINQFVIFTTHIPLDVDKTKILGKVNVISSPRTIQSIHLPTSTDLNMLRKMSHLCNSLTKTEAIMYGNIPSLIYTSKCTNVQPEVRFASSNIILKKKEIKTFISYFITELLDGDIISYHEYVNRVYEFATIGKNCKVKWPICYISCIFSLFLCDTTI